MDRVTVRVNRPLVIYTLLFNIFIHEITHTKEKRLLPLEQYFRSLSSLVFVPFWCEKGRRGR